MQSNWQHHFFKDMAVELWRRVTVPEMTRPEVDLLERVFQQPGANLLDVPCGDGRHALELASRGYSVTGVDQSEESNEYAQRSGAVECRWRLGDMCDLPWVSEFDGAYCFGNSFPYLNHEGVARFLSAVCKALKPGGKFVIDTGMAAESILPNLLRMRWHQAGDIFMLSQNRYDPAESRLDIDYTFIQNGRVDTRPSSSYCFTVAEIRRMHTAAGLDPVEQWGSMTGDPYQLGSPRLILVSQKRHEP